MIKAVSIEYILHKLYFVHDCLQEPKFLICDVLEILLTKRPLTKYKNPPRILETFTSCQKIYLKCM